MLRASRGIAAQNDGHHANKFAVKFDKRELGGTISCALGVVAVSVNLSGGSNFNASEILLFVSASNVETHPAVRAVNTGSTLAFAKLTHFCKAVAKFVNAVNRLEFARSKEKFRNPYGAFDVSPVTVKGGLERIGACVNNPVRHIGARFANGAQNAAVKCRKVRVEIIVARGAEPIC